MIVIVAAGARDFRKKLNRAVENERKLGDSGENDDLDDGALYSGNNELVYGL